MACGLGLNMISFGDVVAELSCFAIKVVEDIGWVKLIGLLAQIYCLLYLAGSFSSLRFVFSHWTEKNNWCGYNIQYNRKKKLIINFLFFFAEAVIEYLKMSNLLHSQAFFYDGCNLDCLTVFWLLDGSLHQFRS